jgi:lysine-N-methylase
MLLRKPGFYDRFKCTASRCSDTCCIGWEIDVDKASQEAYRKVAGVFGDKLRANIEEGHFKLLPHDRCPFLDQNNLCEIYKNLGEGALCDICREHPRFVEVYGDIMEKGLGLCCEEAARLLLEGEGPLQFITEECNEPEDEIDEDDREIRDQVFYERESVFRILANTEKPFANKLYEAFGYTGLDHSDGNPFDPFNSVREMVELLAKTESFGPTWDETLARIKASAATADAGSAPLCDQGYFSENESLRLLAYLVYRHYAKSLFEGREQGKLKFALFFWNVVRFFTRELAGSTANSAAAKINAIKILSRQLEYSEENMILVESALDE